MLLQTKWDQIDFNFKRGNEDYGIQKIGSETFFIGVKKDWMKLRRLI